MATIPAHANGEISELITRSVDAAPSTITADGVIYEWGQEKNLLLDGFFVGNDEYTPHLKANSVSVQRHNISGVATGELCGIFAERLDSSANELKADFPALTNRAGICDMPAMLMSSVINRGTLDTFTNTGPNPNNIERIDYRFDGGIVAPSNQDSLAFAGHVIGEKHGNNRVQLAAIMALDEFGQPSQFGPLVGIGGVGMCVAGGICYGQTILLHDYVFFKSHSLDPLLDLQKVATSREPVAFAFLSMETLSIPAGSIYYGISVFPHDVNATEHDLLDTSTFPDDTEEPEVSLFDSADIYGGSASLYSMASSDVTGRVFCQAEEGATAPRPNTPVSLFRDSVADGVLDVSQDQLIAELPGTTTEGRYSFLALENGSYFVVVSDRIGDDSASLAFVINNSAVAAADIVLDEACEISTGPIAVDDSAVLQDEDFKLIAVLINDRNSLGVVDAPELRIISVSGSLMGDLEIQDRAVAYTLNQSTRDLIASGVTQFDDAFTYILEDDRGLTSEAMVNVDISLTDEGVNPDCLEQDRTDCLFVETEVEGIGVGRTPLMACLLLLIFVVIRRHALFAWTMGDRP